MIKPGDIVTQNETRINNFGVKDNKVDRLSIVLFTYTNTEGTYACTVPITHLNIPLSKVNSSKNYCSLPYLVLDHRRNSIVKLDSAYVYNVNTLHSMGLYTGLDNLIKIIEKLLCVEDIDLELFDFISKEIRKSLKKLRKEKREKKRMEQEEKREKQEELKKIYGNKKGRY